MITQFYSLKNNTLGLVQNNPLFSIGTNLIVDSTLDAKLNGMTYPLFLTMWGANGLTPDTDPGMEVVEVTARTSVNNYTIVRGQEGTSGSQHNFGDNIGLLLTTGEMQQIETSINNLETYRDTTLPILLQSGFQNNSYTYADDTGTANTYIITLSPSISTYTKGQKFSFKAANSNTGTSTLNINGKGAEAIKKSTSLNLIANDILAGMIVEVEYDGVNFQITSLLGNQYVIQSYVDGQSYLTSRSGVINTPGGFAGTPFLQTIAHGLGRIPHKTTIQIMSQPSNAQYPANSYGIYENSLTSTIYTYSSTTNGAGTTTSLIAYISRNNPAAQHSQATITVDATNIYLTWVGDATWGDAGILPMMWTVQ